MLKVASKLGRAFGGLKVRYKLMVLHNLFFLILSGFIYAALMPVVEQWVAEVKSGELRSATPVEAGATVDEAAYDSVVRRVRLNIFVVLVVCYWLGVIILEGFVMRSYIYAPLKALLDADEASRRGDTERELIGESLIQGDELGRLIGSRNATLRKLRQHENELREALAQLEETAADLRRKNRLLATAKRNIADQDRLASLGMMTAAVAHELNTPLAVLQGSVEQLLEAEPDAGARQRLERMQRVTERLQSISASMLDYSRVRKHDTEPVLVRPLIDEAWRLVSLDAKADRTTFRNAVSETDRVVGNADRLGQLFLNLLRNALQATPEDGRIEVSSLLRGGELAIWIDDNGPGIPDEMLADVFEAFITTRLDSRGTGLGLTVAEGIAHQHGGSIRASNRPEGGARLEVCLPTADGAEAKGI